MSVSVSIVFPHQLFQNHPALDKSRRVYLTEEWLFFRQYLFHVQKLVLHRASMKFYEQWLQQEGYEVSYIESQAEENDIRKLIVTLSEQGVTEIHISDPTDNWLLQRIQTVCKQKNIHLQVYDNPNFLQTPEELSDYFKNRKRYFQTDFYIHQRKQRNILLEKNGEPFGGKWTFDAENREKFPKKGLLPPLPSSQENPYIDVAKQYVQKYFSNNPGALNEPCHFAVTFSDAENRLDDFLQNRFIHFGTYEDAIVAKESVLYHSVLSPMLNTGLLQPQQVISKALLFAEKHDTPLNSVEGFIRQIMGWREFIRFVYEQEGSKQRNINYWRFIRKIPASFRSGTTGIPPIDNTIQKILKTGYCHHIERLMVLGNFMLLCEFDPDEVYQWFMEMFIDAYDWVMVPNVYGMTQFADGGLMTTKPYISGSNYLMKMSDYEKGSWQAIWDGLFWRFMHVHRNFFLQNPRMGMLIKTFDKMPEEKRNAHIKNAEKYLQSISE